MSIFVLNCKDLAVTSPCCETCYSNPHDKPIVYPAGLYGTPNAPDQSMGIKVAVCCHHIHHAHALSRGWWINELMSRQPRRYTKSDIIKLVSVANSPELYYKTWGSLHEEVRGRETTGPKLVRPRTASSNCPNCSEAWNQTVCDSCGHTGV